MVDFEEFMIDRIKEEPHARAMNEALLQAYKQGLVDVFFNPDKNDFDIAVSSDGQKAYLVDIANKFFEPAES